MFTVFEEASQGVYQKTLVAKKDCTNESFMLEYKNGQPIANGKIIKKLSSYFRRNCINMYR